MHSSTRKSKLFKFYIKKESPWKYLMLTFLPSVPKNCIIHLQKSLRHSMLNLESVRKTKKITFRLFNWQSLWWNQNCLQLTPKEQSNITRTIAHWTVFLTRMRKRKARLLTKTIHSISISHLKKKSNKKMKQSHKLKLNLKERMRNKASQSIQ